MSVPRFDASHFSRALASAIATELNTRAPDFAHLEMRALAIDCHPWHGILELCFMTDEDLEHGWSLADWRLFQFTDPEASGGWKAVRSLCQEMQQFWQSAVEIDERKAAQAAAAVLRACAVALLSQPVTDSLGRYRQSEDFLVWVADPDDPRQRNYCETIQRDARG